MISANLDRKTRKAVYQRDHYRCVLCDSPRFIQIHHAIPRGDGGDPKSMHNLVTLCQVCHAQVHGLDIDPNGYYGSPAELTQEIVVYLADLYAPEWWPWRETHHPGRLGERSRGG